MTNKAKGGKAKALLKERVAEVGSEKARTKGKVEGRRVEDQ